MECCGGNGSLAGPRRVCVDSADVADAFYQFSVDSICEWFGLDDPVLGSEIGVETIYAVSLGRERRLGADEKVFPVFRGMPQGWTWALHFCMMAVEWGVGKRLKDPSRQVREGLPAARLGREPMGAVYVDNLSVFGLEEEEEEEKVHPRFDQAVLALEEVGFMLHEVQRGEKESATVGIVIRSDTMSLRHKPARAWRLYEAARELLKRKRLSGDLVRVIIGHYNHYFTLARPAMSVFFHCDRFIQEHVWVIARVPNAVKQELLIGMGLIFLAEVRIGMPRSRCVHCVDASARGYAMLERDVDPHSLEEVCFWRERWRFVDVDPSELVATDHQEKPDEHRWEADFDIVDIAFARSLAEAAGLGWPGEDRVMSQSAPLTEATPRVARARANIEVTGLVPRLPEWLVASADWKMLVARPWSHQEAIHMKEGRVSLMTLRRQSRRCAEHGRELLALSDDRSRARRLDLLSLCRRSAGLQSGCELSWRIRYVEADRNAADKGTIMWDHAECRRDEEGRRCNLEGRAPIRVRVADGQAGRSSEQQEVLRRKRASQDRRRDHQRSMAGAQDQVSGRTGEPELLFLWSFWCLLPDSVPMCVSIVVGLELGSVAGGSMAVQSRRKRVAVWLKQSARAKRRIGLPRRCLWWRNTGCCRRSSPLPKSGCCPRCRHCLRPPLCHRPSPSSSGISRLEWFGAYGSRFQAQDGRAGRASMSIVR